MTDNINENSINENTIAADILRDISDDNNSIFQELVHDLYQKELQILNQVKYEQKQYTKMLLNFQALQKIAVIKCWNETCRLINSLFKSIYLFAILKLEENKFLEDIIIKDVKDLKNAKIEDSLCRIIGDKHPLSANTYVLTKNVSLQFTSIENTQEWFIFDFDNRICYNVKRLADKLSIYKDNRYMFSLKLKFIMELNKEKITNSVRSEFELCSLSLTSHATLQIKRLDHEWIICDSNQFQYNIIREKDWLHVYKKIIPNNYILFELDNINNIEELGKKIKEFINEMKNNDYRDAITLQYMSSMMRDLNCEKLRLETKITNNLIRSLRKEVNDLMQKERDWNA